MADPASAAATAKRHNAAAKKYFHLGKFAAAAAEYEKAYQAKPLPVFLYNLGQCHKRLATQQHLRRARFYFRSYLTNVPDHPNRQIALDEIAEVEQAIARLERQRRATDKPNRDKPTTSPTSDARATAAPQASPSVPPLPTAATTAAAPAHRPPPAAKPFYRSWWFWTAVGAVVVGATAATIVAAQPSDTNPVVGSMPPGQIDLATIP